MDGLLVIAAIILLAIPVTVIALVIGQSGLRGRVSMAEAEINVLRDVIEQLRKDRGGTTTAVPLPEADPVPVETTSPGVPPLPARTGPPEIAREVEAPVVHAAPRAPSPVAKALADLGPWLQENWFYAVSAASLALAGIFLVQYGMENGLLPPRARVAAALAFGMALIGLGEFIRRRFGDTVQSATAYLPAVFSGAGIVTLFGAILSARMLYDLIGGGAAMTGMAVVALIAVVLGWMHGPLLVAVGVIGAYGAPVVLGSSSQDASPLFGYFAVVAMLGLGVDTVRRWGWISALTLALAYLMGFAVLLGGGGSVAWTGQLYFAALPLLAILIPARSFSPDHAGPPVLLGLLGRMTFGARDRGVQWPAFPTSLAFGSVAASCVILLISWKPGAPEIWVSVALLAFLGVLLISWSNRAPALQDAALLPPLTLLLSVFAQGENRRVTFMTFTNTYTHNVDAAFPWVVTILVGLGVMISLAALWRSLRGGPFAAIWAAFAAVFAPAMAILLEMAWQPAAVIGSYPWALHAAGLAALMAFFAERFARKDGQDRLRVSFAIMSALACMAFAFVIVLSSVALTVALAVTVVAAAALDRAWNLPALTWFIAAGVVTLGYRLVVDPGLGYAHDAPIGDVLLGYVGTLAAFGASLWLIRALPRANAKVMLDSALWSTAGLTLSILIFRWIRSAVGDAYDDTHWSFGLNAAVWLGLALAQVQRTEGRTLGLLDRARWALAAGFSVIGGGALTGALTVANPLLAQRMANNVFGPELLNTLGAAYLLPAMILMAGAWRLTRINGQLRVAIAAVGGATLALWFFAVIRHFWQGGAAMFLGNGISQPEQYTYTIVLLMAGAVLFYQSLARRSGVIRKAGLMVIGLAVAKVFLIDVTDLDGLTRVFSLLVLGLALAALAWLNRWAKDRDRTEYTNPPPLPPA
ncbi:DUF2339 domain-containing protein [Sulfitobacter guttiformis]|uniref:Putative membrane protein n=1 Tax=Sulfitobacter guttiformis TaxID=74349 RepID=A0A420DPH7_9RHOB|nr:DUF2339 domain-containing protein [Sulfitobacter guttiformis]KIN73438.1 putative membrane protein [Sulfitobacter guttiformis KCTC 32187]RKE96100.1 putative membrane protein [Sulfitobacter guttiformis]